MDEVTLTQFEESKDLESLKVKHNGDSEIRILKKKGKVIGIHYSNTNLTDKEWLETIEDLQDLRVLYFVNTKLENFELSNCPNIEFINISENASLQSIIIKNTPKLTELNASFCSNLKKIHIDSELPKLEKLDISFSKINHLILPKNLPKLYYFDFSSNQLSDSSFLSFLQASHREIFFQNFVWKSNPLADELLGALQVQDFDLVLEFLKLKKSTLKRNKLILLGNTQAGKTTLCNILDSKIVSDGNSTHGVNIFKYQPSKDVLYQVYDFGGQDFYHNTHLAFFGEKAKYIMVYGNSQPKGYDEIDAYKCDDEGERVKIDRKDTIFPMTYWLGSIASHLRKETKQELSENEENKKEKKQHEVFEQNQIWVGLLQNVGNGDEVEWQNNKELRDNYGVTKFWNATLKPQNGDIATIKKEIDDWLISQSHKTEVLENTLKWEAVLQEKANQNYTVLPKTAFIKKGDEFAIDINNKKEVLTPEDFTFLNAAFVIYQCTEHSISEGEVQHKLTEILKNNIIVNLERFTKWIYDILKLELLGNGYFTKEEAQKYLKEEAKQHIDFIIDFLLHNDMIFRVENEDSTISYVVPQYRPLPQYPAEKLLLQLFEKPFLRYIFDGFYHTQILTMIVSEFFDNIAKEEVKKQWRHLIWKNRVILQLKEPNSDKLSGLVSIEFKFPENGSKDKPMLQLSEMKPNTLQHEDLKKLINFIDKQLGQKNIVFEKEVKTPNDTYISYDLVNEKNQDYQGELTDLIYDPDSKFIYRKGDFPLFVDKEKYPMKKIFISYSKSDVKYRDEFKKHFYPLKRQSKIDTFDDSDLGFGEWNPQILKKIEECDIFVCLVSIDFLNTDYIINTELPHAIKHEKLIVPIKIRECDWSDFIIENDSKNGVIKLGQYNAPLKAKPLTLFDNADNYTDKRGNSVEERDAVWTKLVQDFKENLKKESQKVS